MTTTDAAPHPSFLSLTWKRAVTELRIFTREKDAMVFGFFFPIGMMLLFSVLIQAPDIGQGVPFKQYFLPAMVASGMIYMGFQNLAIQIPVERDQGVLKRLQGTPMPAAVYFSGKIVQIYIIAFAQVITLLLTARFILDISLPTDTAAWLTFAWVFTLGVAVSTILGIAYSSVPRSGKSAGAVVIPVVIVMQFLSGVFFAFHELPEGVQRVAEIFPLKWLAQAMRSVFLPDSFADIEPRDSWELPMAALVLTIWVVIGLILAFRTFRWSSRKDG